MLENIDYEEQTEDIVAQDIYENPWSIQYANPDLLTEEVCLKAVEQDGYLLDYVPEHLQTEDVCLTAVDEDGWSLQYVAKQTENIVVRACKEEASAISLCKIPITQNIYDAAFERDQDYVLSRIGFGDYDSKGQFHFLE